MRNWIIAMVALLTALIYPRFVGTALFIVALLFMLFVGAPAILHHNHDLAREGGSLLPDWMLPIHVRQAGG